MAPNTGPNSGLEAHLPDDPPNASVYYHNRKRSRSEFQFVRRAPMSSGAQSPDDSRRLLREFAPESATQARSEETSARASLRRTPHPHRHRIERGARRHEQPIVVNPSEAEVCNGFRGYD